VDFLLKNPRLRRSFFSIPCEALNLEKEKTLSRFFFIFISSGLPVDVEHLSRGRRWIAGNARRIVVPAKKTLEPTS